MYVDESGDPGVKNSPTRYFTLTGVVVHELRWKPYLDDLVTFRRNMKSLFGLKLREEIHAGQMLTKPGELARIPKYHRLEILRRFADQLARMEIFLSLTSWSTRRANQLPTMFLKTRGRLSSNGSRTRSPTRISRDLPSETKEECSSPTALMRKNFGRS